MSKMKATAPATGDTTGDSCSSLVASSSTIHVECFVVTDKMRPKQHQNLKDTKEKEIGKSRQYRRTT